LALLDSPDPTARAAERGRFRSVIGSWALLDFINVAALAEYAPWVWRPRHVPTGQPVNPFETDAVMIQSLANADRVAGLLTARLMWMNRILADRSVPPPNPKALATLREEARRLLASGE
jgi:hypothetical protein